MTLETTFDYDLVPSNTRNEDCEINWYVRTTDFNKTVSTSRQGTLLDTIWVHNRRVHSTFGDHATVPQSPAEYFKFLVPAVYLETLDKTNRLSHQERSVLNNRVLYHPEVSSNQLFEATL